MINWMYNSSLSQFLEQFELSVHKSEKVQPTHKRVEKIVDYLTYQVTKSMLRRTFLSPFSQAQVTCNSLYFPAADPYILTYVQFLPRSIATCAVDYLKDTNKLLL